MSDFLTDAAQAKGQNRGALLRALGGQPDPAPDAPQAEADAPAASFDGGARESWPNLPTPSHGEFLFGIITQSRGAPDTW